MIPPAAASVWLYAVPTTPAARLEVVTVTCGLTVMLRFLVAACGAGVSESVAVTVKFEVPAAVGIPEIAPVALFRDSPAGKLPVVTDQV